MENGTFIEDLRIKMAMFYSYVQVPEGKVGSLLSIKSQTTCAILWPMLMQKRYTAIMHQNKKRKGNIDIYLYTHVYTMYIYIYVYSCILYYIVYPNI